jgi:hypothetical protein
MLDVKKSKYQKTERCLMKRVDCHIKLIALVSVGFFLLDLVLHLTDNTEPFKGFAKISYYALAMVISYFCLQSSFFFGMLYLTAMYCFQRFEFKRHRFRVGMMVFIMVDSLVVLCIYWYVLMQT